METNISNKCKAYTSIDQSKKLLELGIDVNTADVCYHIYPCEDLTYEILLGVEPINDDIPAWSLAALLDYLREIDFFPSIEANEHGVTMNVCYYDEEEGKLLNPVHDITTEADNFVDACYEIIIKLHE